MVKIIKEVLPKTGKKYVDKHGDVYLAGGSYNIFVTYHRNNKNTFTLQEIFDKLQQKFDINYFAGQSEVAPTTGMPHYQFCFGSLRKMKYMTI